MPRENLRLGVVAPAVSNDPRSAPARAREADFRGLLFDAYSSTLNVPDLSASGRREFSRLLSSQDQQLVGLRWDTGARGLGPGADVDQAVARLARVMEAAAALGTPLVCVDLGALPEPPRQRKPAPTVTPHQAGLILLPTAADVARASGAPAHPQPPSPPPNPSFVSQVDDALAEIGRRADRYGVVLALRSELSSLAALGRAIRQSGCPWFGVDLDPVSVLRDEWDLDETFSQLGPIVRHVRARDAIRGADRRTKPAAVGNGDVKWEHLLSNLDGASYAGWLTVDPLELPDRARAAAQARNQLARLLTR